jgi:uncharacterized membrane protein YphA (DoxX/SURF4 family)
MKYPAFIRLRSPELDIALLVLRIFLGLRLIASGLWRLIQWERIEKLSALLLRYHVPSPITVSVVVMIILITSGVALVLGWKTKPFMCLVLAVVTAVLFIIPSSQYFRPELPGLAIMIVSCFFILLPVGKFTLAYMSRLKAVNKRHWSK